MGGGDYLSEAKEGVGVCAWLHWFCPVPVPWSALGATFLLLLPVSHLAHNASLLYTAKPGIHLSTF